MTGWQGTDPVAWAKQQKRVINVLPARLAEAMANAMATRVGVGGFTPVDTGNLSRSVTISASPIMRDGPGYNSPVRQDYRAASSVAKGDGSAYVSYKAIYAHRVNYGFVGTDVLGRSYNQSGRGFNEANIARFPAILAGVVSKLRFE